MHQQTTEENYAETRIS